MIDDKIISTSLVLVLKLRYFMKTKIKLFSATDPQTSLDQLHHDLSLLVNANKDRRSEKFDEKSRRKKISLPSKLSRTKTSREMGSWEFQEKYAIPRKASLDSVSPVGLGTQAASADSRFNLRDKLRNSIKSGSELNRSFEKPSSSVKSGFSHLECCSEVPYNLEEEPEETEGSFTPPTVHPIPPNPETDKVEFLFNIATISFVTQAQKLAPILRFYLFFIYNCL